MQDLKSDQSRISRAMSPEQCNQRRHKSRPPDARRTPSEVPALPEGGMHIQKWTEIDKNVRTDTDIDEWM